MTPHQVVAPTALSRLVGLIGLPTKPSFLESQPWEVCQCGGKWLIKKKGLGTIATFTRWSLKFILKSWLKTTSLIILSPHWIPISLWSQMICMISKDSTWVYRRWRTKNIHGHLQARTIELLKKGVHRLRKIMLSFHATLGLSFWGAWT